MKRIMILLSVAFLLFTVTGFAQEKIEPPKSCQNCGMNRTMFAFSRVLITFSDGGTVGTCSLHCAAAKLKENPARKVKSLQVADYKTRQLIDAKSAIWVIGGSKGGVMTAVPKWAFGRKADAEAFIKANGGKLASFEDAMALAEKEQE